MNKVSGSKKDSYNDYLRKLHEQTFVSDESINHIVVETTGGNIVSKTRIISGEVNEVYDVVLDNSRIIVRISPQGDEEFQREVWAQKQCKKAGVPVPETLAVKNLPDNKAICIQRKINGEPLERGTIDYWSLPKDEVKKYLNQAGSILSRIHTIPTDGFGLVDSNGKGEKQTFKEEMAEHLPYEASFVEALQKYNLDTKVLRSIFQILSNNSQNIPDLRPVLNHNDYAPKHFLVRDSKIVGIIDFGQAGGHSPINDFAKWLYWYGSDTLPYLKEGYENKSLLDSSFDEMLSWIAMNNGLSAMWWYVEKDYKGGVVDTYKRLEKIAEPFLR